MPKSQWGELVISANNNICTLFSPSHRAEEQRTASTQQGGVVMWVQPWAGRGKRKAVDEPYMGTHGKGFSMWMQPKGCDLPWGMSYGLSLWEGIDEPCVRMAHPQFCMRAVSWCWVAAGTNSFHHKGKSFPTSLLSNKHPCQNSLFSSRTKSHLNTFRSRDALSE